MTLSRMVPLLRGGNARAQLSRLLSRPELFAVANYRADLGVTGTLNASAIANQIGIAGPLLQATGANQPIVLAYSGQKYAYLPVVAGNTLTAASKTITGNFVFEANLAPDDWTGASADLLLFTKQSGLNGFAIWWARVANKPYIHLFNGIDGAFINANTAPGWADASQHVLKIAWEDGVGATFFYDGVQNGAQVAAARTLSNANTTAILRFSDAAISGKYYSMSLVADSASYGWQASDWPETTTNGATQASSTTGEVWMLSNTGTKLAQIVASSQLLFDGAAHFMKAAFALVQPTVVIAVLNQITHTSPDYLIDGNTGDALSIGQSAPSPRLIAFSGAALILSPTLAVNTYGILSAGYNGASGFFQLNANASVTGNIGSANAGGITVGATTAGANFGNMQVKEVIPLNAVPSAAKLAQIISLLNSIHTVF